MNRAIPIVLLTLLALFGCQTSSSKAITDASTVAAANPVRIPPVDIGDVVGAQAAGVMTPVVSHAQ
jgi:hypothetical protein